MKTKIEEDDSTHPASFASRPLKEGEDFYREGASMVFTARYLLRRGYCCANGCRHCPYTPGGAGSASAGDERDEGDEV